MIFAYKLFCHKIFQILFIFYVKIAATLEKQPPMQPPGSPPLPQQPPLKIEVLSTPPHAPVSENLVGGSTLPNAKERCIQWYLYNKDGEYATNLYHKVFAQFKEHIGGIWITRSTNYHSSNANDHVEGVSHKEAMRHFDESIRKTPVEKRRL